MSLMPTARDKMRTLERMAQSDAALQAAMAGEIRRLQARVKELEARQGRHSEDTWGHAGALAHRFFRRGFDRDLFMKPGAASSSECFRAALRCLGAKSDGLAIRAAHPELQGSAIWFATLSPFKSVSQRGWARIHASPEVDGG